MGKVSDLKATGVLEKRIMARRIAIFEREGAYFGIQSECGHMKASLAKGKVCDGIITCPWHGWKYDLANGDCLTVAGVRLKTYPVEVDEGVLYLVI